MVSDLIDDQHEALRLVWFSGDFDKEGKLKGSAFSQGDLIPNSDPEGNPRYVSMDLKHLVSQTSVDWLIARGRSGHASDSKKKAEARFALFLCEKLRALRHDDGAEMFYLKPCATVDNQIEPGSPSNPAHIGVCSATPAPLSEDDRNLKVDELRTKLLEARKDTLTYGVVFDAPMS